MHHHTRKKKKHNKSKGLKNNKRNLKSKSKSSRKVNKMKGGLASCTPGPTEFFKKTLPNAWNEAKFTKDEIINAVKKLCDKFNSVLKKYKIERGYKIEKGERKTIDNYTELNVNTIESGLNSLDNINYDYVKTALAQTFVFTDVVEYSEENSVNTRTNSKDLSVEMCQLMKTVYYLIKNSRLPTNKDPFIDNDVSTHFANISPTLNIKNEALDAEINATHKALVESGFLEKD
jgi:hypothetical protein